jgi:predicted peptidase
MEVNRILDKISRNKSITEKEKKFLDLYQITREDSIKDYLLLEKNNVFNRISQIMNSGKKVICDLNDRDGKIGLEIIKLENNFEDENCTLTLKGGSKHKLIDKFLYNLIYITKKDQYSLQEHGEYFEKIESKHD